MQKIRPHTTQKFSASRKLHGYSSNLLASIFYSFCRILLRVNSLKYIAKKSLRCNVRLVNFYIDVSNESFRKTSFTMMSNKNKYQLYNIFLL
mmetsp:Transcript_22396/g.53270  ORF Transcript_22396/g.53270 Transcript_22396/m.53270 type:complete len:92 (-) Transcript_22396:27-302(-)